MHEKRNFSSIIIITKKRWMSTSFFTVKEIASFIASGNFRFRIQLGRDEGEAARFFFSLYF